MPTGCKHYLACSIILKNSMTTIPARSGYGGSSHEPPRKWSAFGCWWSLDDSSLLTTLRQILHLKEKETENNIHLSKQERRQQRKLQIDLMHATFVAITVQRYQLSPRWRPTRVCHCPTCCINWHCGAVLESSTWRFLWAGLAGRVHGPQVTNKQAMQRSTCVFEATDEPK